MHTQQPSGSLQPAEYLREIGVQDLSPLTSVLDPGFDPVTIENHLRQSAHLIASLELYLSGWLLAREDGTKAKLAAARQHGIPSVASDSAFEIALAQGRLPQYLDLCAALGLTRIVCGEAFT